MSQGASGTNCHLKGGLVGFWGVSLQGGWVGDGLEGHTLIRVD